MSIVIVSMFGSSGGGGANSVVSTGGDVPSAEVVVEASAEGGGGDARRGSVRDSTGGAGSLFEPKVHQLEACLTDAGPCHCRTRGFNDSLRRYNGA